VYENDGSEFPAGEKGKRRPGPVEDGKKTFLSYRRESKIIDNFDANLAIPKLKPFQSFRGER